MAEDTAVTIAIRARDEASPVIEAVGKTVTRTAEMQTVGIAKLATSARRAGFEVAYLGGSLLQMAGYLEKVNNPLAKTGAHMMAIVGGISSAVGSALIFGATIVQLVPKVIMLVNALRAWFATQAALTTLSTLGTGAALVGAALAVGVGAYAGTSYMMKGASAPAPVTVVNNGVLMGNEADARALARRVQELNRSDTRLGR